MRKLASATWPLFASLTACSDGSQLQNVRPSERAIVVKALEIEGNGKVSRAELLAQYDPVVVYLPTMTCVGLNLKKNWAGGDTTICLDGEGKQVLHYVNGD